MSNSDQETIIFRQDRHKSYYEEHAAQTNDFVYPDNDLTDEEIHFTRDDILDVLSSLCRFDVTDFRLVRQKLRTPSISLSDLGQMLGMSKEAIDKRIAVIINTSPAWEPVLRNIPMKGGKIKKG